MKNNNIERNQWPVLINPALLRQAVIGISDGLIIPFAIITGVSGIVTNTHIIFQVGLIALISGGVMMGLGAYFAAKGRLKNFAQKTNEEEQQIKKLELEKTIQLFKTLQLGKEMQDQAAIEIENDSKEWKAYLQQHLPELEITESAHLPKTAFIIAASYALGGLIPLLPYAYFKDVNTGFLYSGIITIPTLVIFGLIKSKVNKEPLLWGALRLLIMGVLAAAAAFAVAKIFSH
jgi:predicted membrane protein (TIGR00267 family)